MTVTVTAAEASEEPGATTVVPLPEVSPTMPGERRRTLRRFAAEDAFALLGALAAAVAATTAVFVWLAPFSFGVGYFVSCYVTFLLFYAAAVAQDHRGPAVRDRLAAAAIHGLALLLFAVMAVVVLYPFVHGWYALFHWNFWTRDASLVQPKDPITKGGVEHAIVGSLIEIGLALAFTIPLGVLAAVMMNEMPGRFSRTVRTIAEAATALPSVVAGLFVYAVLLVKFGHRTKGLLDKGGLAAAIAIGIMMLPIVIRASDVVLRLVPGTLKEASYALGAGQWATVWHVTLPTARSGLVTAVILGTARGIGETSPVLLCAGYSTAYNANPFHDPMTSLPLAVFTFVQSPEKETVARAYGAACVLLVIVLVLFATARLSANAGRRKRSARQ